MMFWTMIIIKYTLRIVIGYFIVMISLASIIAAYQESKIWKNKKPETQSSTNDRQHIVQPLSLIGFCKVVIFNATWMIGCFIGSTIILIKYYISFGNIDLAYECHIYVEHPVSMMLMEWFIGTVHIDGIENLPPNNASIPAPVYIANHASQLDISSVYYLSRRFKWIAKQSVLYLPGVGQVMYFAKHILIKRSGKNKESVNQLFIMSNDAIQHGIPMFLFPQGTRVIQKQLPFKNGAFIMAQTNKSIIIPITIQIPISPLIESNNNTNNEPIIYANPWNILYPFTYWLGMQVKPIIRITIHKPIQVTGQEDMNILKEQCMKIIYSVLPPFHHNDNDNETTRIDESKKAN